MWKVVRNTNHQLIFFFLLIWQRLTGKTLLICEFKIFFKFKNVLATQYKLFNLKQRAGFLVLCRRNLNSTIKCCYADNGSVYFKIPRLYKTTIGTNERLKTFPKSTVVQPPRMLINGSFFQSCYSPNRI